MIVVLKPGSDKQAADEILARIEATGCKPLYMPGTERIVLGAIGDERVLASLNLEGYPQVERVTPILSPYKLVSRELHPHETLISLDERTIIGSKHLTIIAGPCAVENYEQMHQTAQVVKSAGANCLRGGAFKPRSSPYSFQGLGEEGLRILQAVSKEVGLPTVSEVIDASDVDLVARYVDVLQVGARNMQNYRLLEALGGCAKPVILKRGMSAGIIDLLLSAEYIVNQGNSAVILCERGIKTFETATRNTMDLSAIPYIKQKSHLPIIADPSHGTGVRELVTPMACAAVACGADGLMIEVHCNPAQALSDGKQSLFPDQFNRLMQQLIPLATAVGKTR